MPAHIQLGNVSTYYGEDGTGDPVVLLHPGGADSRVFETNLGRIASDSTSTDRIDAVTGARRTSRGRLPMT